MPLIFLNLIARKTVKLLLSSLQPHQTPKKGKFCLSKQDVQSKQFPKQKQTSKQMLLDSNPVTQGSSV